MSMRSASLLLAAFLFSAVAWGGAPPTPLPPAALNIPAGSLIYSTQASGSISAPGEIDEYSIVMDANQTISVVVLVPSSTLQPTIVVRDPSSAVIGSGTSPASGQPAVVQTVGVATAGTYTISVSGTSGTTGNYGMAVNLNEAFENERFGGASNNILADAQNLASSAIPLATGVDRLAVTGVAEGVDYYSFLLEGGHSVTMVLGTLPNKVVTMELRDSSDSVLATGATGPTNVNRVIRNFVAPTTGTYYARIGGSGTNVYNLIVIRDGDFDIEGNDTHAGAQDLRAQAVLGAIGNSGCDSDIYSFRTLNTDTIDITTSTPAGGPGQFENELYPEIALYFTLNGGLDFVGSADGNQPDGRNSRFTYSTIIAGEYHVVVHGSPSHPGTTGEYVLTVTGKNGTPLAQFTPSAPLVCNALSAASPAHLWIGLKSSDNQGTNFDLKVELLKNGNVVASGLQRCITGVTRNPSLAKEAVVNFDAFSSEPVASGDVLALRASTRIGTNPNDTKCAGHNSAAGLRLYYDAGNRPSRFDATITPDSSKDFYLHSNGSLCGNAQSSGVTQFSLDNTAPAAANPRCKDSGTVNFSGGNPFSVIGTWSLAPLP